MAEVKHFGPGSLAERIFALGTEARAHIHTRDLRATPDGTGHVVLTPGTGWVRDVQIAGPKARLLALAGIPCALPYPTKAPRLPLWGQTLEVFGASGEVRVTFDEIDPAFLALHGVGAPPATKSPG